MRRVLKKEWPYILFIVPALIGYTLFVIYPLLQGFRYAFTNWDGHNRADFVGLRNFVALFNDAPMMRSLGNTLIYAATVPVLVTALAIPLALILNSAMKTRNLQRAIFFFPSVPSILILGYLWSYMLSPTRRGLVNSILDIFGIDNVLWLATPTLAMISVIVVAVWQSTGWHACIYLANLQSIPHEYIEAAKIDGAKRRSIFRYVTFPMLAPSMTISVLLLLTGSLGVFALPFALTGGGPGFSTTMVTQIIITRGVTERLYGRAAAMSLVYFFIICICTVIQLTLMKRREERLS
jgi:ABC-type sugar transport system permease subunit